MGRKSGVPGPRGRDQRRRRTQRSAPPCYPAAMFEHFIKAQDRVWDDVVAELRAGEKQSHWMWFVFPQHVGLGRSPMAQRYGITGLAEARAYLDHPVLGARLREVTRLVLAIEG